MNLFPSLCASESEEGLTAAVPVELTFDSGRSMFKSMGPTFWLVIFSRDFVGYFFKGMSM
jgi:hypothetical protein